MTADQPDAGRGPGSEGSNAVELPAPTAWPMIAALGVALGFGGLVTHALVSAVGVVLAAAGAIGWFREVLPVQRVEVIPLRPPAERAKPVLVSTRAVTHLVPGEAGHRMRLPVEVHPYSSGLLGGIAGSVAMAVVATAYGLLSYGSVWYPINLLAAVVIPSLATADTAQLARFDAVAALIAIATHGVVSVLVGLVYAAILPMFPRRPAFWGGLVAPLLWSGLLWATLGVINPTLNARIDWPWFVASQIAFGIAAGAVIARTQRIRTMQAWPLAARAGIEAPGLSREERGE
ncbi:MAG: hypothetical protein AB7V27_13460 [Candidatus Binatia bacterium]